MIFFTVYADFIDFYLITLGNFLFFSDADSDGGDIGNKFKIA